MQTGGPLPGGANTFAPKDIKPTVGELGSVALLSNQVLIRGGHIRTSATRLLYHIMSLIYIMSYIIEFHVSIL